MLPKYLCSILVDCLLCFPGENFSIAGKKMFVWQPESVENEVKIEFSANVNWIQLKIFSSAHMQHKIHKR